MNFKDPIFFTFLLFIPVLVLMYWRKSWSALRFSSLKIVRGLPTSWRMKLRPASHILRCVAAALFIAAMARPQKGIEETKIETEGIDIALAVDISGSMLAEDFTVDGKYANRLQAVKKVVNEFIRGRVGDRIGLVVFAARPYTQCPLTLDYGVLTHLLENAQIGMIEDGTAIGSALAACVNRLKNAPGKSKVAVLLTDGVNNAGNIDPLTAASLAKTSGIKVYTIGAGTRGMARYPVRDFFGNVVYQPVEIPVDDALLTQIAETTGARYFRATDTASLASIYKAIDQLEKTTAEVNVYVDYHELFPYFLVPGLLCLLTELGLSRTLLRKLP